MPGDNDPLFARSGNRRHQVHHLDLVERRLVFPRLLDDGDAGRGQLLLDVLPCLLEGRRSRRPRTDGDHLAKMFPRAPGIEFGRWRDGLQREGGEEKSLYHARFSRGI